MELVWDGFRPCRSVTYSREWRGWNCFGMVSGPVGWQHTDSLVSWWMHGFGVVSAPVGRRHTAENGGDRYVFERPLGMVWFHELLSEQRVCA